MTDSLAGFTVCNSISTHLKPVLQSAMTFRN